MTLCGSINLRHLWLYKRAIIVVVWEVTQKIKQRITASGNGCPVKCIYQQLHARQKRTICNIKWFKCWLSIHLASYCMRYHSVDCFECRWWSLQWYTSRVYSKRGNHPVAWIRYVHLSRQLWLSMAHNGVSRLRKNISAIQRQHVFEPVYRKSLTPCTSLSLLGGFRAIFTETCIAAQVAIRNSRP